VWLSVLTLLTLQASFLVPPFGYAVMTARTMMAKAVPTGALARAMAPFLGAQALVFILVVIFPGLTHLAEPESAMARTTTRLSDEDVQRQFDSIVPAPPPEESPEPQSDP
ncbi:MAG: C4-dicarboxylate ABC transporter permease, partial [Proteobacteria bacterium]|nr:C4-dicarboxylate ABC transporter permease [Pseudomonadota bacterium]